MEDGRFVNRPYECQALYVAWQYVRLFRQFLNSNYFQVWTGHVPPEAGHPKKETDCRVGPAGPPRNDRVRLIRPSRISCASVLIRACTKNP